MKKGYIVCGCYKADVEFCKQCPQGKRIQPNEVYVIPQWSLDTAFGPKDVRREN